MYKLFSATQKIMIAVVVNHVHIWHKNINNIYVKTICVSLKASP